MGCALDPNPKVGPKFGHDILLYSGIFSLDETRTYSCIFLSKSDVNGSPSTTIEVISLKSTIEQQTFWMSRDSNWFVTKLLQLLKTADLRIRKGRWSKAYILEMLLASSPLATSWARIDPELSSTKIMWDWKLPTGGSYFPVSYERLNKKSNEYSPREFWQDVAFVSVFVVSPAPLASLVPVVSAS